MAGAGTMRPAENDVPRHFDVSELQNVFVSQSKLGRLLRERVELDAQTPATMAAIESAERGLRNARGSDREAAAAALRSGLDLTEPTATEAAQKALERAKARRDALAQAWADNAAEILEAVEEARPKLIEQQRDRQEELRRTAMTALVELSTALVGWGRHRDIVGWLLEPTANDGALRPFRTHALTSPRKNPAGEGIPVAKLLDELGSLLEQAKDPAPLVSAREAGLVAVVRVEHREVGQLRVDQRTVIPNIARHGLIKWSLFRRATSGVDRVVHLVASHEMSSNQSATDVFRANKAQIEEAFANGEAFVPADVVAAAKLGKLVEASEPDEPKHESYHDERAKQWQQKPANKTDVDLVAA